MSLSALILHTGYRYIYEQDLNSLRGLNKIYCGNIAKGYVVHTHLYACLIDFSFHRNRTYIFGILIKHKLTVSRYMMLSKYTKSLNVRTCKQNACQIFVFINDVS